MKVKSNRNADDDDAEIYIKNIHQRLRIDAGRSIKQSFHFLALWLDLNVSLIEITDSSW